jgi:hypothetical protein
MMYMNVYDFCENELLKNAEKLSKLKKYSDNGVFV